MGLSYKDAERSVCIEDTPTHTVIVLQSLCTGYCGSDSTELTYYLEGSDILRDLHELAMEHASSWGYDGEEDEETGEWIPNENVCGVAYHFDPRYHMGYTAGGGDEAALLDVLIEAGIATLDGVTLTIDTQALGFAMAGDSKENIKLVDGFIQAAISDIPSAPYGSVTQIVWS
ncbi:hypothetical protein My1_018 [Pectobacterium phage My1]|uniref:Uncharacterized protein n=1 Tax=Pectobacterium phage My1 TaxID=1204539 RepID=J9QP87_9CAUD|nr:hypothetical protein My1_018 [Pectobacterium phage My1]AFQ22177.1 hypothetical protein My1_018 [Pectobacterium phage My1]